MERERASGSEQIERQRHWDEIAERVGGTVDKLEHPIDEGIKQEIIAFNAFDINTTASCEGHLDWGVGAPWIDVESKEAEVLKKQWQERRKEGAAEEELDALVANIERKNLEERRKLFSHLETFYDGRNASFHQRLVVQARARGLSRLESQGTDFQKTEDKEAKAQRLREYREEMKAFGVFLKEKYFGGAE